MDITLPFEQVYNVLWPVFETFLFFLAALEDIVYAMALPKKSFRVVSALALFMRQTYLTSTRNSFHLRSTTLCTLVGLHTQSNKSNSQ